ncbi:hypothetical protein IE077_000049 [Cardiosporidium cionae]|uniref:DOT1 domain-containing protein n=1 Tax=Cardiosporidium cionae TaxID=476202 RepID=A0ABQ7J6A9_9APIC|nr:hypothetical protein IE077_000049 [Cardiosporidium cionae]|eukprot:KAF8819495.1 hypothetical protein IE077_000049 [Cardiosporidium cionae]
MQQKSRRPPVKGGGFFGPSSNVSKSILSSSACLTTKGASQAKECPVLPLEKPPKREPPVERPTAFLFKGPMMQLGTSTEGMYGEISEAGIRAVAEQMCIFGLDEYSVVLDLGSGRGVPNVIFAHYTDIFSSIGIEKCEQAFTNCLTVVKTLLERELEAFKTNTMDKNHNFPKRGIAFANEDLSSYDHFEGVTHFYSFDAAMEGALINNMVYQFMNTHTAWFFASFHSDLCSRFGLEKAKMATKFSVNMTGSGEGRTCFIYLKNDWESIKKLSKEYLLHHIMQETDESPSTFQPASSLSLSQWEQPLHAEDLIKLTKAPLSTQIRWYSRLLNKTYYGVLTRSQKNKLWGSKLKERKQQSLARDKLLEMIANGKSPLLIKRHRKKLQSLIAASDSLHQRVDIRARVASSTLISPSPASSGKSASPPPSSMGSLRSTRQSTPLKAKAVAATKLKSPSSKVPLNAKLTPRTEKSFTELSDILNGVSLNLLFEPEADKSGGKSAALKVL